MNKKESTSAYALKSGSTKIQRRMHPSYKYDKEDKLCG